MRSEINIKIGGKVRPVKFGLYQSIQFCKALDIDLDQADKKITKALTHPNTIEGIEAMIALIYSGLWFGLVSKGKEADFTKYDVGEWIEQLEPKDVTALVKAMGDGSKVKEKKTPTKASR